ncbi:hypothetical protein CC79DRAFT_1401965 [Sarocladium strictum]
MAIQKTFTIVPTVSRDASPVPAFAAGGRMTSKQVKEAYKTANKGPKMTRAERLQMERAEQQRIRKEMEKEKASAKARLLRDKKKEKEKAEMEVKRKAGKPLVKVRPSQDLIARFVKGSGPKRDCSAGVVVKPPQTTATLSPKPEAEVGVEVGVEVDAAIEAAIEAEISVHEPESAKQQPETTIDATTDRAEPEQNTSAVATTAASGLHTTSLDSFLGDDIPSDLLKDFESSFSQQPQAPVEKAEHCPKIAEDEILAAVLDDDLDTDLSQDAINGPSIPEPCHAPEQLPRNEMEELDALLDDDLELDMIDDLGMLGECKAQRESPHRPDPPSGANMSEALIPSRAHAETETEHENGAGAQRAGSNFETTEEDTLTPSKPSAKQPAKPITPSPRHTQAPPTSTQAIMLNLDDFFPTSSQQARELDLETDDFDSFFGSLTPRQAMPPPPAPPPGGTPKRASETHAKSPVVQPQERGSQGRDKTPLKRTPTPSPVPQRWFTASGSKELESLMMQRSRRTAALEEIQQKERRRAVGYAGDLGLASWSNPPNPASQGKRASQVLEWAGDGPPSKKPCPTFDADKENIPPDASQETDYGGGGLEDFEF